MPLPQAPRARRAVTSVLVVAAVLASSTGASRAAPEPWTPVKADPQLVETAPSRSGPWFGWAQNSRTRPDHTDYLVQRGARPPVTVNAPGTQASSGAVLDRSVVYSQQRGERRPRLFSFDLRTQRRTALPPAANRATYRGRPIRVEGPVSADGPWVLFRGLVIRDGIDAPLDLVVLYHRVTRELRVLQAVSGDYAGLQLGQVNGRYATWLVYGRYGDTSVTRFDTRTGRATVVDERGEQFDSPSVRVHSPGVSADGTVYYWRSTEQPTEPGEPYTYRRELLRRPVGGRAAVVTSEIGRPGGGATWVEGRADGSTLVYVELDDDIRRLVDRPS